MNRPIFLQHNFDYLLTDNVDENFQLLIITSKDIQKEIENVIEKVKEENEDYFFEDIIKRINEELQDYIINEIDLYGLPIIYY